MDTIIDWIYSSIINWFGQMIAMVGNMGYELFEIKFVQAIVAFFHLLGWALFITGLVVSGFETGIDYSNGRANIKDTALNAIKGFMAVSMFTVVPVRLFKFSIDLQALIISDITGMGKSSWSEIWYMLMNPVLSPEGIGSLPPSLSQAGLFSIFFIIMMAYAFVKVFFASLKRGGILLIQMSVGSLYMFSVPRGYSDGFFNWCKQVIGLCLTSFLQGTILTIGALILKDHPLLGLGMMLSATEIPRIAGAFGLDTSARVNIIGAVHGAQMAAGAAKTIASAVK